MAIRAVIFDAGDTLGEVARPGHLVRSPSSWPISPRARSRGCRKRSVKSRPRDWVCVGAVRNDSRNRRIYLGCAGKRWCQENATHLSEWVPVVANRFVGRDLSIARFLAPDGYAHAPVLATRDMIYPGLIDLHNHLAHNALPAWAVGKRYEDRSQWRRARDYDARVGILRMLKTGSGARAVARCVEIKALLGGAITLQGMRSTFGSVSRAMRGLAAPATSDVGAAMRGALS